MTFILIIAGIILFHMLVDTITSWQVFGPILRDKELDEFFKRQPLELTDIDHSGELLHWIGIKKKDPVKAESICHHHFIARQRTSRLWSKYWIDEIGQVDRFSKWSKKIDERYKKLGKK